MLIKHLPCGLSPYYDCGYQRTPHYPLKNEKVEINCRIEHLPENADVFIQWTLDGMEQERIKGTRFSRENDDRAYFSFNLGPFDQPVHVTYKIIAKASDAEISTKDYSFDVLTRIELTKPELAGESENSIWAVYKYGENYYSIEAAIQNNLLRLSSHSGQKPAAINALKKTNGYEYKNEEGYSVKVSENPFGICISKDGEEIIEISEKNMALALDVDAAGNVYKVGQTFRMQGKGFYGFGEKFDRINQKGLAPKAFVVEKFTNQQDKTYIPMPFFFTEKGYGFYRDTSYRSDFFLNPVESTDLVDVRIESLCRKSGLLFEDYIFLGKPSFVIKEFHKLTGAPALPPRWTFGPWISANGWNTQSEAQEQIEQLNFHSIPATVMVLEAWSDEETFYIFNDAKYELGDGGKSFKFEDFTFEQQCKWPDLKAFTGMLEENNIKLILWQIPVIKYIEGNKDNQLFNDESYVIKNKYCIMNDDGTPYRITDNWFNNSLVLDFTNPEAVEWWFKKREYLLTQLNVAGFKTDGGEFIYDSSARFYNGKDVEEMHNLYPNLYVGAYNDFLKKHLGEGNGVTFSRAGFTGAQKYPIHWAGDQLSTYSELRGQLTAGISAGLSGILFWSFDIGGFAGEFPTTELYIRSVEFAAFCPIMQFHSEPRSGQFFLTEREHWINDRSPWNMARVNKDNRILEQYRKYANIRMNLIPYLIEEASNCVNVSRPMMAHLIYDYPEDENVINIDDEYMLGRALLVAPVIKEGQTERSIYLPEGEWYDFWTGERIDGGKAIMYPCALDRIPVFVKGGSLIPVNLNEHYIMGETDKTGFVGNNTDEYANLCFLVYGEGECSIKTVGSESTIKVRAVGSKIDIECSPEIDADKVTLIFAGDNYKVQDVIVNGGKAVTQPITAKVFGRAVPGYAVKLG